MNTSTFTFDSDPEKQAVVEAEIARIMGVRIVSESEESGRTSLVITVDDPWPPERMNGVEATLSFFVQNLVRVDEEE